MAHHEVFQILAAESKSGKNPGMRFAHLTDLHLPIPSRPRGRELMNKRALGYLSWTRNRRRRHVLPALEAVLADCRARAPDFTVITGDAVNIALPAEFDAAVDWFSARFDPATTLFTPGNHDTYVALPWTTGAGRFSPFMIGRRRDDPALRAPADAQDFPFIRTEQAVAFIMANSSPPTAPGLATGRLGEAQLLRIRDALLDAGKEGLCRVLALHHPVTDGATPRRKALDDDRALRAILAETGVELVLHGHTHRSIWASVSTPDGPRPVAGGASASHPEGRGHYRPARYNLFACVRESGRWRIDVVVRELDPRTGTVETAEERRLLPA